MGPLRVRQTLALYRNLLRDLRQQDKAGIRSDLARLVCDHFRAAQGNRTYAKFNLDNRIAAYRINQLPGYNGHTYKCERAERATGYSHSWGRPCVRHAEQEPRPGRHANGSVEITVTGVCIGMAMFVGVIVYVALHV